MNIDRVRVKGLFDDFDHDLAFATGERIMIVIGPNGYGKTTTLKLINVLFNQSFGRLAAMPFSEVQVFFDDGTCLTASRNATERQDDRHSLPLTLAWRNGRISENFQPPRIPIDSEDLRLPISAIEDVIPELTQVGPRNWHNSETGSLMDLEDVLMVFWDDIPHDVRRDRHQGPGWLQDLRRSVTVRLIDTERLTRTTQMTRTSRRWRHGPTIGPTRTVSHYSQELAHRIRESIAKYGALSQSLDRTFPVRLVTERRHSGRSVEALREDLDAIELARSRLEDVGLLAGEHPGLAIPDLSHVDDSQRGVLAVYAQDAKEKLAVFDELYDQVSTFKRIANSRFRHKRVAVSADGLSVARDDGTNLDLGKLSSGEQHELVMLYELLFRAPRNSLILIDEPELSLHVAWQEQWVKDLQETAALSGFRAIVATHSPEIIGDRWALTVALQGRNDE